MDLLFFLSLFFLLFTLSGSIIDPTRVTQLLWEPRVFLYKGFLSNEECDHLISLAKDKLEVSTVVDNESGENFLSDVRTSSGMFLNKYQDEIMLRIEQRIAAWTFLPIENGEQIQILRYQNGQKYEAHTDYFIDPVNINKGGHRIATVLMYLSNVTMGGETVFPYFPALKSSGSLSACGKTGYAVKPYKGDAVLFFSLAVDGKPDPASLHGSCPVIEGEKWSATKWIHVRSYDEKCVDRNVMCSQWAEQGECKKNPAYMVGKSGSRGFCRKSCGVCV